jgi:hypothetical protein
LAVIERLGHQGTVRKRDLQVIVLGSVVHYVLDDNLISLTRRTYGIKQQQYCWVSYLPKGGLSWQTLGDPWPCSTPKRKEIREAIEKAHAVSTG